MGSGSRPQVLCSQDKHLTDSFTFPAPCCPSKSDDSFYAKSFSWDPVVLRTHCKLVNNVCKAMFSRTSYPFPYPHSILKSYWTTRNNRSLSSAVPQMHSLTQCPPTHSSCFLHSVSHISKNVSLSKTSTPELTKSSLSVSKLPQSIPTIQRKSPGHIRLNFSMLLSWRVKLKFNEQTPEYVCSSFVSLRFISLQEGWNCSHTKYHTLYITFR